MRNRHIEYFQLFLLNFDESMAMKRALIRSECKRKENIGLAVLRLMHRIDFSFFREMKTDQFNSKGNVIHNRGKKVYSSF